MVMLLVPPKKDTPSPTAVALGGRLQALRERRGKTQKQIGEALGISHKTVSAYETGRAVLGSDDFGDWAQALGVSIAEFASALGLGLPPSPSRLRESLAGALGPDKGSLMDEIVHEIGDWPEDEQRVIIELFRNQTFNWPKRPDRS